MIIVIVSMLVASIAGYSPLFDLGPQLFLKLLYLLTQPIDLTVSILHTCE